MPSGAACGACSLARPFFHRSRHWPVADSGLICNLARRYARRGFSALGAALVSLGIPNDSVLEYETEIKAGNFALIVHGTADEVAHAKETLGIHSPAVLAGHL